jgi:tRNA(Leu) C34 or U34 (ribose-2'-O)-methylase TrmL
LRGYHAIALYNPKYPVNVAGVLRAADCFGAAFVAYSGRRYKRHAADTQKAYRRIPLFHTEDLRSAVPFDCVPVAIELLDSGRSLPTYTHPERAFYIFGQEDGTLGSQVLSWCRDVVYVPTRWCMNLAATVNVVLYDRLAKNGGVL